MFFDPGTAHRESPLQGFRLWPSPIAGRLQRRRRYHRKLTRLIAKSESASGRRTMWQECASVEMRQCTYQSSIVSIKLGYAKPGSCRLSPESYHTHARKANNSRTAFYNLLALTTDMCVRRVASELEGGWKATMERLQSGYQLLAGSQP